MPTPTGTRALRIAPNELHITDPEAYNVIYSQTNNFKKYDRFYDMFDIPHSLSTEVDIHLHKGRRQLLSPFFSRTAVLKREHLFQERALILVRKIRHHTRSKPTINVTKAMKCVFAHWILRSLGWLTHATVGASFSTYQRALILDTQGTQ